MRHGGITKIIRILKHVLNENRKKSLCTKKLFDKEDTSRTIFVVLWIRCEAIDGLIL